MITNKKDFIKKYKTVNENSNSFKTKAIIFTKTNKKLVKASLTKSKNLIRNAVNTEGSYNPEEIMYLYEENLTPNDNYIAYAFLYWISKNNLGFGYGNYEQRIQEFISALDTLNESKLRSIKVDFENGDSITTNMAGHLSDQEMLDYYKVGKSFNIGKGGNDLISKVKSAQILESFSNDMDVEEVDAPEYNYTSNNSSIATIENDLYDIIEQLPGTQNSKQLAMGVDKDFGTLYFHKSGLNRAQISQLETQFKELISKYTWADMVSVDVTRLNGDDVSFNVNYEENVKESFNDDDDLQEQVESDLYDIIDELPGIQNEAQAVMGVDSDEEGDGTTVLFFYKDVDEDTEISTLENEFKQLVSKFEWADSVYTNVNEVDGSVLTPGMKEVSFSVNLNDNDIRESYDKTDKALDNSLLKFLKNIYKNSTPPEKFKKKIEELEARVNEAKNPDEQYLDKLISSLENSPSKKNRERILKEINKVKEKLKEINKVKEKLKDVNESSDDDKLGINLRSLLDGEIAINMKSLDLSNYNDRNELIDEIEKRIQECDWVSLSNGTTYTKTEHSYKQFKK